MTRGEDGVERHLPPARGLDALQDLRRGADRVMARQRGHLLPWAPVFMALGVAFYFALPAEPTVAQVALAGAGAVLAGLLAWLRPGLWVPLLVALALVLSGIAASGLRTHLVAGPVLQAEYRGVVTGRIIRIDRSASDALRVTLDRVGLEGIAAPPRRVRISLFGEGGHPTLMPGQRMQIWAMLSPPSGPTEPGGFDFQRHAWFQGIGAVGFTRDSPALARGGEATGRPVGQVRRILSEAVQARIDGQAGAFAAAVLTGDRSGLERETVDTLRDTNIAHLLAISGLHMGLMAGFVFVALRRALALIPALALRYPVKKWAAFGALVAAAAYLALSGGNVATERAFVQVAVMLVAVLIDRRAITLRSVAIAALIVLSHRPETLLSPGFQMSFAATTALVWVFDGLRRRDVGQRWPGWARAVFALVVSSAVAGAATAPFALAHFNQTAAYGLLANLLSVPVMGTIVIPSAVVAACLAPLGLENLAFFVTGLGLEWILGVAARIAAWDGAVLPVAAPPMSAPGLVALGALMLILWQGWGRLLGLPVLAAALALWIGAERPGLLIGDTGRIAGVLGPEGRSLSRARGEGFVARVWLENDGDFAEQAVAAERSGWRVDGDGQAARIGALSVWTGPSTDAARACRGHEVVITGDPLATLPDDPARVAEGAVIAPSGGGRDCVVIGPRVLAAHGALALHRDGRLATAHAAQGDRPWMR